MIASTSDFQPRHYWRSWCLRSVTVSSDLTHVTNPSDICLSLARTHLTACPIFSTAKNLETLELKSERNISSAASFSAGIRDSTSLVSLKLDTIFAGHFLDRLHSPLLKTLQFSSLGSAHQLKSFLVRSKPPLTSLTVTALIDVAELFHSLRYASDLTILRIREDPVVWGQQVERLKLGSPINENICPALEFIGFEGCIGRDMKYLEEVLSRWKGPNDATASPKSTKGPECATDGGWMRNLGRVYVDDWMHAQSPDSRFTARPRIRKSVEEGLVVFEDYPYGSDFWL